MVSTDIHTFVATKLVVGRAVVSVDSCGGIEPLSTVHRLSEILQVFFG